MKISLYLTTVFENESDMDTMFFHDFASVEIQLTDKLVPARGDSICLLDFSLDGAPDYWYEGKCSRYDYAVHMLGKLWVVESRDIYFDEVRLTLRRDPVRDCQAANDIYQ